MTDKHLALLGSPDVKLAGFQLWIHGYQFPEAKDYWDGNWLNVTAHCGSEGASVFTSGPIVHLSELHTWSSQCERINSTLSGDARLECMEQDLAVSLGAKHGGHITMEVSITPNQLSQKHWFQYSIDQSYLTQLLAQLKEVFSSYPMRAESESGKEGT